MSDFVRDPSRRLLLQGSVFAAVASLLPAATLAQSQTIRLGALVPLTGAGGSYGPAMAKIAKVVVDGVNAVGGINGRKLDLIVEDDQTSPEAAVRAARKLIDIDKVVAIMGTWASAVTTAVAPLCWESKTFLTTTSGADSITLLPHQGYLIRTQPNTTAAGSQVRRIRHRERGEAHILHFAADAFRQEPVRQHYRCGAEGRLLRQPP